MIDELYVVIMSMTYYKLGKTTFVNNFDFDLPTAIHAIIVLSVAQLTWSDLNLHPEWEKPDAFSQRKSLSSGKPVYLNEANTHNRCRETDGTKNDNLQLLYKKLVKFLLKRESMKV